MYGHLQRYLKPAYSPFSGTLSEAGNIANSHFSDMVKLAEILGFSKLLSPPKLKSLVSTEHLLEVLPQFHAFPILRTWQVLLEILLFSLLLGRRIMEQSILPRTIIFNTWQVTKCVFVWWGEWLGNLNSNNKQLVEAGTQPSLKIWARATELEHSLCISR